jgi:hypothetical protein
MPETTRKPAWRAAALAYREQRRTGASDHASWLAAVEALRAVWPLPLEDARREMTHAIAYATSQHGKWFWDGVSDRMA